MPITTPRLLIRPPQTGDGITVNTGILESFETLHQFMDLAKEKPTVEESEIYALTQYAFKQLGVKRITITCDADNVRSKKIPEKLGYTLEATLKANRRKPSTGELSDTLVYAKITFLLYPLSGEQYDRYSLPHRKSRDWKIHYR